MRIMISWTIRFLLIVPSILFFLGIVYRCLIDYKTIQKIDETDVDNTIKTNLKKFSFKSFLILFTLDSLFILMVNGLIMIFQIEFVELGVLLIFISAICIAGLFIGIFIESAKASEIPLTAIFGIIGFEVGFFLFTGILGIELIFIASFLVGIFGIFCGREIFVRSHNIE